MTLGDPYGGGNIAAYGTGDLTVTNCILQNGHIDCDISGGASLDCNGGEFMP